MASTTVRPSAPEILSTDLRKQADRYEQEASRLLARAADLRAMADRAEQATEGA